MKLLTVVAALAVGLGLLSNANHSIGSQTAVAASECSSFTLDFAGLPAGTKLLEQYAAQGIHISAIANEGRPNQLIVFDSNASHTRDPKMEVRLGNLAIIPENLDDSDNNGLVDMPNNSIRGGKQVFLFDHPRSVESFLIVDIDHGNPRSHFVAAYDAEGNLIKQVSIPIGSDGNVQTITVQAEDVSRLEIVYRDSSGLTNLKLGCSEDPQDPQAESVVAGTMSIRPPETGDGGLRSSLSK